VNSQGETREKLLSNLREALAEAIEMNREDARKAAGEQCRDLGIPAPGESDGKGEASDPADSR